MRKLIRLVVLSMAVWSVGAFAAGVVAAGEEEDDPSILDGSAILDPDPTYEDADGQVVARDNLVYTSVSVSCADGDPNDFTIACETTRPDKARVRALVADIQQKQKGNNTRVFLAGRIDGSSVNKTCSCEKATQKGKFTIKDDARLDLSCDFKRCDCLADLTERQLVSAAACLDRAPTKTFKGKIKDGLFDGKLRAKGAAVQ